MPTVRRTDEAELFRNHERRILALERSPGLREIYVDDRVLTDPVPVVTFTGFPSDKEILELTWQVTTDIAPCWLGMLFNGDFPTPSNDYWWRLFGDVAATDDDLVALEFGAIGGSSIGGYSSVEPLWGRVRFPNYNEPTGAVPIIFQGEGGVVASGGATPHTFIISGCGDPETPLTEINVFAVQSAMGDANLVAPSRLTLTCY